MDGQPITGANGGAEQPADCRHELTFNLKGKDNNRLAICLDCGRIIVAYEGVEAEGRIEAAEPIIQAIGEALGPIIRGK